MSEGKQYSLPFGAKINVVGKHGRYIVVRQGYLGELAPLPVAHSDSRKEAKAEYVSGADYLIDTVRDTIFYTIDGKNVTIKANQTCTVVYPSGRICGQEAVLQNGDEFECATHGHGYCDWADGEPDWEKEEQQS